MVNARLRNAFHKAVETAVGDRGQPATLGTAGGTIFYDDGTTVHKNRVWVRMGADHQNLLVAKAERQGLPAVAGLQVTVVERHGMLYVVDWDQNQAAPAGAAFEPTKWYKNLFTPEQWYPDGGSIVAGTVGTGGVPTFAFDSWNFQSGGTGTQYLHLIFMPGIAIPQNSTATLRLLATLAGGGSANTTRITAQQQIIAGGNLTASGAGLGGQTLSCTGGGRNVLFFYDALDTSIGAAFDVLDDMVWLIRLGRNYDHADDTAGDVHFSSVMITIEGP